MNDKELRQWFADNPSLAELNTAAIIELTLPSSSTVRQATAGQGSQLEERFANVWKILGGPEPERELQFHDERKWRFDFAWPAEKVAIEIEGGTWTQGGGRHNRAAGFASDCVKYNAATLAGWKVFRITSDMLDQDPAGHLEPIINLLKGDTKCP